MRKKMTEDEINAKRTPAGGWTRAQLKEWGVEWPPKRGWKAKLMGEKPWKKAGKV